MEEDLGDWRAGPREPNRTWPSFCCSFVLLPEELACVVRLFVFYMFSVALASFELGRYSLPGS